MSDSLEEHLGDRTIFNLQFADDIVALIEEEQEPV